MNIEEIALRIATEVGVVARAGNDADRITEFAQRLVAAIQAEQEPVAWRAINSLDEIVTNWIDGDPPKERTTDRGDPINCTFQLAFAFPPAPPEGWRPIATAPKDGTRVLVWFKQHGCMSVRWTDRDECPTSDDAHWYVDDHKFGPYPVRGYGTEDATHWMPLPAAPKPPL